MKKKLGLAMVLCLTLLLLGGIGARGEEAKGATVQTGKVTATSLNVRTGAGTSYSQLKVGGKAVTLKKGTTVTIKKEAANHWYKVSFSYNGSTATGYVLGDYLSITTTETFDALTTVKDLNIPATATTGLRVRTKASATSAQLTSGGAKVSLVKGQEVTITKTTISGGDVWYYVQFTYNKQKVKGYVHSDYVKLTFQNKVPALVNSSSSVKVRTKGESDASYLKIEGSTVALKPGKEVTLTKEVTQGEQKWFYLSFTNGDKTYKGYLPAEKIAFITEEEKEETPTETPEEGKEETTTEEETTTVKVGTITASSLYVRKGYGTSYDKKTISGTVVSLKKGTEVTIEDSKKVSGVTWYKVTFLYNKKEYTGYVSGDYLKISTKAVTKEPEQTEEKEEEKAEEPKEETITVKVGTVTATSLSVRTGYGTTYARKTVSGVNMSLKKGTEVTIEDSKKVSGVTWYKVTFLYNKKEYTGYVSGDYLKVTTKTVAKPTEEEEKEEETPVTPGVNTGVVLSDAEFEASLTAQGFPETYKPYLRLLHQSHPTWVFQGFNTGLSWETVIANETLAGKNLITNSRDISFKSFEASCYNYATDSFVVYDGSSWVTASSGAVRYYMDPRNWMSESYIYMFETQSYSSAYQTVSGVENILKNTPLYQNSFTYVDSNGAAVTKTYSQTIMDAAVYSGVSPYMLASRIKQEVVTGTSSLSGSASGTYSGYEGYYNFYNIGANNSADGSAVAKALTFAKTGTTSIYTNDTYKIPWNNPYNAIVGGAYYIGLNYIGRGQDTIYLQKFNVTSRSTYSHQYMANVEAPYAEAAKSKAAYSAMGEQNLIFSIPIYSGMPGTPEPYPSGAKSPNNWLGSLTVSGGTLSPAFTIRGGDAYTVTVPMSLTSVTITGAPVQAQATVSGTGTYSLTGTSQTIPITVTAPSGAVRTYQLTVIRN